MRQAILSIFIIVLVQGHVFGQESTEQAIDYSLTTQVTGNWVLTSTKDFKTNDTTLATEDVDEFPFTYKVPDLNYIISPAKSRILGTSLVKKDPVMNIKNLLEEYYKDDSYKLYTFNDGTFSLKNKDKIIVFTRQ